MIQTPKDRLVIATRGSKLALWQAEHISALLEQRWPGLVVERLVVKTTGDIIQDVPLAKVGGKGLFVKEIEEAMLDGRADLAVHSMKDVPVELPEGLVLGVVPEREVFTDTLLLGQGDDLDSLPAGARVGTSSLRRQAQLKSLRPDLEIVMLRGNVDTRLRKLAEGQYDAIVMASAGLKRLGLVWERSFELGPPSFLPAVGQGALGLEYRRDDPAVAEMLAPLDHAPSHIAVDAERGFLTGLDGGCQVPIAAHAVLEGDVVTLTGFVADPEGRRIFRREARGAGAGAFQLGLDLAREVLDAGAAEVLAELYDS